MPNEMTSMHANIYIYGPFIIDDRSASKNYCGMNFWIVIKWSQMALLHKRIILKSSPQTLFIAYIFYQEKYAWLPPQNWYDKLQNIIVFCKRLLSLVK